MGVRDGLTLNVAIRVGLNHHQVVTTLVSGQMLSANGHGLSFRVGADLSIFDAQLRRSLAVAGCSGTAENLLNLLHMRCLIGGFSRNRGNLGGNLLVSVLVA